MAHPALRPADRLELTILVDNYTDLLLPGEGDLVRRARVAPPCAPLAEHGLACLLRGSHAGIINTVGHAQRVTGVEHVHAVLGGFHLGGPLFESSIAPTVEAMQAIGPEHVVPMHCTGCAAIDRFAAAMPKQFLRNSVGTTYVFG